QLPDLVQRASVLVMFAIELGAPFAILGPRRLRHAAAGAMIALQLGIPAPGAPRRLCMAAAGRARSAARDSAAPRARAGRRRRAGSERAHAAAHGRTPARSARTPPARHRAAGSAGAAALLQYLWPVRQHDDR